MAWIKDRYADSKFLKRVKESKEMHEFDVDGTLVTQEDPSDAELVSQSNVLTVASGRGAVGLLTARRRAMLMDGETYLASRETGLDELPPQFGFDAHKLRVYVPPENVRGLVHLVKAPLSISALGEGISLLNGKGYRRDREYDYMLALGAELGKKAQDVCVFEHWRNGVLKVLRRADKDGDILRALSAIDFHHNYLRGLVDVPGPPYRIELRWDKEHFGRQAFAKKMEVVHRLKGRFAQALAPYRAKIIDESKPGKRSQIYIVPVEACKRSMIDRKVDKICEHTGMTSDKLTIYFFGDMPPDLEAGFIGGRDAKMRFGLAGGSAVSGPLMRKEKFFAGESLQWMYDLMHPTDTPGVFEVFASEAQNNSRLVFVLDALFPGLVGPASIEAFYNSKWAHI